MKKALFIICCFSLILPFHMQAQRLCGYNIVHKAALAKDPKFDEHLASVLEKNQKSRFARKTTSSTVLKIPVVFHIVLDAASLAQMDPSTIQDRVNTQIQVLNEDYNRHNADSTGIPSYFKAVYGSADIQFCLTRKDPNGNLTQGWELINTDTPSFEVFSPDHSSYPKHAVTGGANAWDETKYMNIWVVNMAYNGNTKGIVGLTVPMSYAIAGTNDFSDVGILLSYIAFGRRTSSTEYFFDVFDKGRTLTHEAGHFFNLLHIFGDNQYCPGSGDIDDGIADTPPQGINDYGCPTGIKTDACSGAPNGIMYQNFLDYTDDACMLMFTVQQCARMYTSLEPGGENYSLTTHPDLLAVPPVTNNETNFTLSPNPSTGSFTINLTNNITSLHSITIINVVGQVIQQIPLVQNNAVYTANISGSPKGIYLVECLYDDRKEVRKIVLQ